MQDPNERSHGSGIRNANTGQTSDRQELPKEQRGDSRPAAVDAASGARKAKGVGSKAGAGGAEGDPQEMDAAGEDRKISRLARDPAEGPAPRK
jgi:hypothetical protein